MLNNLMPCSKESLYDDIHLNPPSSISGSEKSQHIYQLPEYKATSNRTVTSESRNSLVCTLASINLQGKVEINEEAFQILEGYSKFQIVYCGVYGGKASGKSTFIDYFISKGKEGKAGFKDQGKMSSVQSLLINRTPISIGENKKLFFIEYSKGFDTANIPQRSQKLLDLLIFISNSFVIMVNKGQILQSVTRHIEVSSKRLNFQSQSLHFWPENLYIVDNYHNLSRDIGSIGHFFRRTSLILWLNGQSRPLSRFLTDISSTNDTKSFKGITNNCHISKKLLLRLEIEQNLTKDGKLAVERIFQQVYNELCGEYLLYHQELYDSTLQQYFADERPYSIDYLIESFEKCRDTIIEHYKENHIIKDAQEDGLQRLQSFIDQRQRLIIQVNKKKSQFELKKEIGTIATFNHKYPKKEQVDAALSGLRTLQDRYEHAGVELHASVLYEMMRNIEKGCKKLSKKTEQHRQATLASLEQQVESSNQQLSKLKDKNRICLAKKQQYESKMQRLTGQTSKLKRQLQLQKRTHKQLFNTKLSSQQKADKMLAMIRELQEKTRQNQRTKREIEKEYDFNPEIERLNRKIERLERDMNGEGSKLESVINSIIQPQAKTQGKMSNGNKGKEVKGK